MAINIPLVLISDLKEKLDEVLDTDNLVIGGADAFRITIPNLAKAILAKATGAISTVVSDDLEPNRVLISGGSGKIFVSPTIDVSELDTLSGATDNIQDKLNELNSILIQRGSVHFTSPTPNEMTSINVTFKVPFASTPTVIVSPRTTSYNVKFVSTSGISASGFTAYMYRTNDTGTYVDWIAIGQRA